MDHFHNDSKYEPHSDETFPLRYWFDATHYRYPGPVIVLLGGETGGEDRLPFLHHGILQELIEAVHGVGVVLEHRFYGDSFPTDNLSVESLRFLDTQQALADVAYFANNVRFKGLEGYMLTSKFTAWFPYGGSYAGSMAVWPTPIQSLLLNLTILRHFCASFIPRTSMGPLHLHLYRRPSLTTGSTGKRSVSMVHHNVLMSLKSL